VSTAKGRERRWRLFSTFPLEFRQAFADTQGMSVSMFTVKPDLTPHDQLRLLEAWDTWDIPRDQQRDWQIQLFGPDFHSHLSDYFTYETVYAKDDQLELPFDSELPDPPIVS